MSADERASLVVGEPWYLRKYGEKWLGKPLVELMDDVVNDVALDLGYAFERCSEWTPPSDDDPGFWGPSERDRVQSLGVCLPVAATIAVLCRHLEIRLPAIVTEAFALGIPDYTWIEDWQNVKEVEHAAG